MNRDALPTDVSLASLHKGDRAAVVRVVEGDAAMVGDVEGASVSRRLLEIGFVPGEPVEVIGEIWPGGDPMAVRVGTSIFALRRREAEAVRVILDRPTAGSS